MKTRSKTGPSRSTTKRAATTSAAIRRLRGILKPKPGDKSFAEEWAAHKRAEIELEDK